MQLAFVRALSFTLTLALGATAFAQVPPPPAAPTPAPAPSAPVVHGGIVVPPGVAEQAPPGAAPSAGVSVDPALMARVQDWTRQLVSLEQRAQAIEIERAGVRTLGYRIGKYISWTAFGVLVFAAMLNSGSAASIDDELDDDGACTDLTWDEDGDGDVDRDDEKQARRRARAYVISSLIPLGLGLFTTIMVRKREKRIRTLNADLDDVTRARRSVLERLSADVAVSGTHAKLGLRLSF